MDWAFSGISKMKKFSFLQHFFNCIHAIEKALKITELRYV